MEKIFRAVLILMLAGAFSASVFASANFDSGEKVPAKLRWNTRQITIAISSSMKDPAASILRGSDVDGAVRRSLATWEAAANVRFRVVDSDRSVVSPSGPRGDGVNLITIAPSSENILLFARDPETLSATTRVFYRRNSITEADIVLNPYQQFSTDGTFGTYDLESTLTHEIGHLLGLGHSGFPGSTMFENYGRNGMFGVPNLAARTLSQIDIAAAAALYGPADADLDCCSSIRADIVSDSRGVVWIEDDESGRLLGGSVFSGPGILELGGLPAGAYRLYTQAENGAAGYEIVESLAGTKKIKPSSDARLKAGIGLIGLNGELATQCISLNSGRTYRIFVGGRFDTVNARVGIDSPYFTVEPNTAVSHDYGRGLNVMSVEVRVEDDIPGGLYSIYVEDGEGSRYFLPGSISIEQFPDPWGKINSPKQ